MLNYINDYNQDPTSLNSDENDSGVWFDIIRTGVGRDTEYDVKRVSIKTKDPQTGKISFVDDRSPLPSSIVENYQNLAYDLSSVYQTKTYEELSEILEANMPRIIEMCPDADLSADITNKTPNTTATTKTTTKATKPSVKVNLNLGLDDEDEEDEEISLSANKTSSSSNNRTLKSSSVDDDFLAQADALLNS
jgi:hypothetical protein